LTLEEFRALGHDVTFEEGPRQTAAVQPNLLRRAVRNLVDNAVKYAGSAEVSVRTTPRGIAVEVADRGPGIPASELGNVLEPFVRLETSRNRETGGSGLGLALARAAAQAHGGTLELENRPGGGLCARIRLENSLNYTDAGGSLRLSASIEGGTGDGLLHLRFDDSAPGPLVHEFPRLFDRLFRGEASRNRETGGSGLGLSICRTIVEEHGGSIDASPSPMGGLRVIVTLPLSPAP